MQIPALTSVQLALSLAVGNFHCHVAGGMAGGGPDWLAAGRTMAEAEAAAAAAARDAAMALDEALSLKQTDPRFMGAAGLAHAMRMRPK